MLKKFYNSQLTTDNLRGFTMIELLIIIVIIGILSFMFINNFPGAQRRARDAQRRNDLKQYDEALHAYASRNSGFYPGRSVAFGINASDYAPPPPSLCADLTESGCPHDPKDGSNCKTGICRYYYQTNNCNDGSYCATDYTLRGRLENEDGFWVICSTGKVGLVAESATFTGGVCPL